jgi:hypothetical protein
VKEAKTLAGIERKEELARLEDEGKRYDITRENSKIIHICVC